MGIRDLELTRWEVSPFHVPLLERARGGPGPAGCRAAWGTSSSRRVRSHYVTRASRGDPRGGLCAQPRVAVGSAGTRARAAPSASCPPLALPGKRVFPDDFMCGPKVTEGSRPVTPPSVHSGFWSQGKVNDNAKSPARIAAQPPCRGAAVRGAAGPPSPDPSGKPLRKCACAVSPEPLPVTGMLRGGGGGLPGGAPYCFRRLPGPPGRRPGLPGALWAWEPLGHPGNVLSKAKKGETGELPGEWLTEEWRKGG